MRKIILAFPVEAALKEIYGYSRDQWGAEQAKKYTKELYAKFAVLAKNPNLGHQHPEVPGPYRIYTVGSHLIVYKLEPKILRILTILHQSMDIDVQMATLLKSYPFN